MQRSTLDCLPAAARLLFVLALALPVVQVTPAAAHDDDHKRLSSDRLKMSWSAFKPSKRKFQYKTRHQLAIANLVVDPSVAGATLTVRGAGAGDGSTGVIILDPTKWSPIGSKGWKYRDDARFVASSGISKIILKSGKAGGSLQIKAKGSFWEFDIAQAQTSVDVLLSIGTDVYCGQYGATAAELARNEPGRVQGKASAPPVECEAVCGNNILEFGEQCDDGNLDDQDTCNNLCEGCLPQNIQFTSTFDGIQTLIFDNPTFGCSSDLCHGTALQGGLDLRAGASYASIVGVASQIDSNIMRVFPGDQDLSLLYTKIASKTLGSATVGTQMPANPSTVTPELLEALRLWIRGGAPQDTVIEGTAALLGACLPGASPAKIPQPDPPAAGTGTQLVMPAYSLVHQSETELCVASFYDLSAPGVVPPQFRVPCPGAYPGTNPSGECFAWKGQALSQDPQSHHSLIHIYTGDFDYNDPGFGPWSCYGGSDDGLSCDPASSGVCPGGSCGGGRRDTVACIGYGPPDYGFASNNSPVFSGAQEPTSATSYPAGVYQLLPLRGVVVWNSHAFNLTSQDMNMEAWLNLDFADQQNFLAQGLFNADEIFVQDVPPYQTREYCYTHTFAEGTRLFEISSHMHSRGKRWRYFSAPQTPCASATGCPLGNPADIFYESTDYSDPVVTDFAPPIHFTGSVADRTIKFCTLFDNGASDPAEVKTVSGSPCPPNGCGLIPGGPCGPGGDSRNPDVKCLGGPNVGQLCTADFECTNSVCDACNLMGGVTTMDEMFIAIGTFYVAP